MVKEQTTITILKNVCEKHELRISFLQILDVIKIVLLFYLIYNVIVTF